jgi:hypothetical protein
MMSQFLPKSVYPVQFLSSEIYFYFTGIEEPFNRGFELKWVKGVKVQQFPSLLVELDGLGPGCSTDMSGFRIITRLVIGEGTKDSIKYLSPFFTR